MTAEQEQSAYNAGYDASVYGANTTNCHFSIFSTHEKMKAWERGTAAGKQFKADALHRIKAGGAHEGR
jgi:hypothetical protein